MGTIECHAPLTSSPAVLAGDDRGGRDSASSGPLRVTVIGGGPVALIFCALIGCGMPADDVRIRIFDHRWYRYARHGRVLWKDAQHGNRRRRQVVTVQSRQYTLLPEPLFRHVFRESVASAIWPTGPDSVNGLAPLNIRISDLEDGLLDWVQSYRRIEFHPARFDAERQLDDLRGEHLVVICDGAGSRTRESLGIFGRPDADSFTRGGRKLEDVVLGLEVKSRLQPSAAVVLTVAQSRFLLNPGIDGKSFLNMRLTDDEAIEVCGTHPDHPHRVCPCTQSRPCLPERLFGHSSATARDGSGFAPSRLDAGSRVWPRIVDGLNLFGIDSDDLKSITSFRLSMVERPRFAAVLFHHTATRPATIAALLGDAAISVHFWPGRGLNTGIGSAVSLAETVIAAWRRTSFREADFAVFEARMAQLQFRNQVRGFYGSMRVDDTTGEVTPIRDLIGRSYGNGRPTLIQHQLNRAILSERLSTVRENLASRLPTDLPSQDLIEAQVDLVTPETIAALVASGPWDTYRPGGPEVNLWLTSNIR
jgi:2-polyprenyl-6-methoxyphenol hydroxylase-like FAD-dependent oxidoreductase